MSFNKRTLTTLIIVLLILTNVYSPVITYGMESFEEIDETTKVINDETEVEENEEEEISDDNIETDDPEKEEVDENEDSEDLEEKNDIIETKEESIEQEEKADSDKENTKTDISEENSNGSNKLEDNNEEKTTTEKATKKIETKTTTLKQGMRSAEIKKMKQDLMKIGFGTHWKNPTTLYGADTTKVVKEFQSYYGIASNGEMNQTSQNKLKEVLNSPYQQGKKSTDIKNIKIKLKDIGYGTHWKNPSTLYGADTVKVVKEFQKSQKLVVNGIVDSVTLNKIETLYKQIDTTTMKQGMRSAEIKKMKQDLMKIGFGTHWKNPSTLYGEDTKKVVKEFQSYYGIASNGEMNQTSQNKLKEVLNSPYQQGKRSTDIKNIKIKLKDIGYGTHWKNPSTIYGTDTVKVVKEFQKSQKLVVNGIVDSVTLNKIETLYKQIDTTTMKQGMRSAEIKKMKQDLMKIGFGTHWKNPTTLYGADTTKVVKEFQSYYGIASNGEMNQTSQNKLKEVLNSPYQQGKKSSDIKNIKNKLKDIGYGTHWKNPSTLYGADTVKVVKEFQKSQKLVVNGIIDSVTLKKINDLHKNNGSEPIIKTEYTNYNLTLNNAINIQLSQSPQTDKYSNDPYLSATRVNRGIVMGAENINIRTKPDVKSNKAFVLKKNTSINFIKEVKGTSFEGSNIWYEIDISGKKYYVHSKYADLRVGEARTNVNVREQASDSSHKFGQIKKGTRVVITGKSGSWYKIAYNNWRLPKANDLKEVMDPQKVDKFQHLRLDSSAGATASQLNSMLADKNILKNKGQAFLNGGKKAGINEAYLVAHAILETGNGKSNLANGIEVGKDKNNKPTVVTATNRKSLKGIKKVYNMYGIGAVDGNADNAGAIRAYEEGWDSPEKAIEGGAKWIGNGYIYNQYKQNTIYKMRWNPQMVNGAAWKQYATDIGWATKQVNRIKVVYEEVNKHIKNPTYHYDIPRYK